MTSISIDVRQKSFCQKNCYGEACYSTLILIFYHRLRGWVDSFHSNPNPETVDKAGGIKINNFLKVTH